MGASITIDLDTSAFSPAMDEIKAATSDLKELCTLLAGRAVKMIDRKFQKSGPGWVPLSARTLRRRRKNGRGAKPLLDTGKLRASTVANGEGGVFEVSSTGFVVGSNLEYAAAHQFGIASRGLPARPFIPTEESIVAEFTPVITRYFTDKFA